MPTKCLKNTFKTPTQGNAASKCLQQGLQNAYETAMKRLRNTLYSADDILLFSFGVNIHPRKCNKKFIKMVYPYFGRGQKYK